MIKTVQAALMAVLLAGAAMPAFAQTTPAPDQSPAATAPDQTPGADTMKPATTRKVHRTHHHAAAKAAKPAADDTTLPKR